MRIALLAAVVLVLAACGSAEGGGSSASSGYAASAVAAPLPPHPGPRYFYELDHVACPSAGSCVATGELIEPSDGLRGLLLVEQGRKWALTEPPLPRDLGTGPKRGIAMGAVSCPAAGACVAVGKAQAGEKTEPVVFTQHGNGWRETALPLPARVSVGGLGLVSCPSVGNCTAAGGYTDSARRQQGLFVTESKGKWGTPTTAGLPSNAGTVSEGEAPVITALACPSPGNCTAVGLYGDPSGSPQGWLLSEMNGTWGPGVEARLPENALHSEGSYLYPVIGLGSVTCTSVGNCTALGGYLDDRQNEDGLILTERDGRWSTGEESPVPPDAGPSPQEGNVTAPPLGSIACASAGSCGAVGTYRDKSGHDVPLLLSERAGKWTPSVVRLPADAGGPMEAGLEVVACPGMADCLAAGSYPTEAQTVRPLLVTGRNGHWGKAVGVALPAGADEHQGGYFTSIACSSAESCVAVGEYADKARDTAAMIVTIRRS
jgi:hypothetical protein